jgi:hypothetical protein
MMCYQQCWLAQAKISTTVAATATDVDTAARAKSRLTALIAAEESTGIDLENAQKAAEDQALALLLELQLAAGASPAKAQALPSIEAAQGQLKVAEKEVITTILIIITRFQCGACLGRRN